MKREDYNKAKEIISVLDRIDRVLSTTTIIYTDKTMVKHSFKQDINDVDLCLLCKNDVKDGFLNLLYDKKIELKKKLETI
jgi:hypothetical protein